MTREFASIDELSAAVGETIGPGEWLTIEQDRIDAFADATGDHQWIHVDPERATNGPYGATIAHGYLTLSLIPLIAGDLYSVRSGSARVNYGSNKVRFPAPVRSGARVRARATIADVRTAAAGTYVSTTFTVEIENEIKPACVADTVTLIVP